MRVDLTIDFSSPLSETELRARLASVFRDLEDQINGAADIRAVISKKDSYPLNPKIGDMVVDSSDNQNVKFLVWRGKQWLPLASGGGGSANDFIDLEDVPSSYSGEGGKLVSVKNDSTGLEFIAKASGGQFDGHFTDLSDVPSSFSGGANKLVAVNSGETALEFVNPPSPPSEFTDLSDTPASYSGQAGKVIAVNGGETALEFVSGGGGGGAATTFLAYELAQGTQPNNITANAWNILPINTVVWDAIGGGKVSILNSVITLAAGVYEINASAGVTNTTQARLIIRDITNTTIAGFSLSTGNNTAAHYALTLMQAVARVEILSGTVDYRIEYWTNASNNSNGLKSIGKPTNLPGIPERYATVHIANIS